MLTPVGSLPAPNLTKAPMLSAQFRLSAVQMNCFLEDVQVIAHVCWCTVGEAKGVLGAVQLAA